MRTGGESPTAEHAALALYLLGTLDETERVAFEEHLAGCWECLSAAGDMGSVTSAFAGLDAADWEALAAPPPGSVTPTPDPVPNPDPVPTPDPAPAPDGAAPTPDAPVGGVGDTPSTPVGAEGTTPGPGAAPVGESGDAGLAVAVPPAAARGTGPRTVGSIRPDGSRPGAASESGTRPARGRGRPPGSPRRRRFLLWGGVAAVVVAVVLAGGVVLGVGLGGREGLVLTATGEAPAQGVSLSVAITTDEERGSTIRITATGLRQGLRYRLFAVTRDGTTHVVRDWTASTGPQEVTGELSLPIDDLAFVTVGLVDGTAIVTAPISR
ncbi:zf-HC2 domain-containing protein [Micromonospora sp. NPDC092111]|uniref:zf-HC2 domain-containing protein n=1 Tax=Micromonospora sp. NPDC092111 TaxID=3364289 RepID=UPI00380D80BA